MCDLSTQVASGNIMTETKNWGGFLMLQCLLWKTRHHVPDEPLLVTSTAAPGALSPSW